MCAGARYTPRGRGQHRARAVNRTVPLWLVQTGQREHGKAQMGSRARAHHCRSYATAPLPLFAIVAIAATPGVLRPGLSSHSCARSEYAQPGGLLVAAVVAQGVAGGRRKPERDFRPQLAGSQTAVREWYLDTSGIRKARVEHASDGRIEFGGENVHYWKHIARCTMHTLLVTWDIFKIHPLLEDIHGFDRTQFG
ncbi:hypothetical protein DFH06DRAFT_1142620 [Mycena polygramma]|nr:hypothetical protein DFH06DRAFT_1142620 [Mycena polygramma]